MPPKRKPAGSRSVPSKRRAAAKPSETLPPFTRPLRFSVSRGTAGSSRAEVLVVYAFTGAGGVSGAAGKVKQVLDALIRSERFRARRGETLLYHSAGKLPARRVIVVGLGKREVLDLDVVRQAAAAGARRAAQSGVANVVYALPPEAGAEGRGVEARARALAEGFLHGTYRMRKYLTGERRSEEASLKSAELIVAAEQTAEARKGARLAVLMATPVNLARDLVNEPAKVLTPSAMAAYAAGLAARAGLECKVYDEDGIKQLGMGAFLGVAAGSHQPPRFIHLIYRPDVKPVRKVALVGKGITFDSGGLSLKSATGMETMKLDKAGASAVLGTMVGLRDLRPPVEVHGLMGMTENMPGGSATKPGDILKTCGGKTVEVLNTDAEGRLVLADLLCYVQTLGVDEVVDLATLTGACVVALGPFAAGVFSTSNELSEGLLAAAARAGEKLCPLPLYSEYREQLRSEIADVKNTGDRYGGAITAALFLKEFIGTKIPWAHLDIAGPAFLESSSHSYMRKGATGAGVRTLLTYLTSIAP